LDITAVNHNILTTTNSNDSSTFNELYKSVERRLYLTAIVILKNPDDAQDAVQETAFIVFKNLNKLKNKDFFKTWATRILINNCKKIYKKNKNYSNYKTVDFATNFVNPYEDEMCLFEALEKLDEKRRIIIILRFFNGMEIKNIAEVLKIPQSTVKTRLYSALNILKEFMEEK
jgi:RNA polymerase sigma-70 factor (ECF subfamily)